MKVRLTPNADPDGVIVVDTEAVTSVSGDRYSVYVTVPGLTQPLHVAEPVEDVLTKLGWQ